MKHCVLLLLVPSKPILSAQAQASLSFELPTSTTFTTKREKIGWTVGGELKGNRIITWPDRLTPETFLAGRREPTMDAEGDAMGLNSYSKDCRVGEELA